MNDENWIDISDCDVILKTDDEYCIKTGASVELVVNGKSSHYYKIGKVRWYIDNPGRGKIEVITMDESIEFESKENPKHEIDLKFSHMHIISDNTGLNTKIYIVNDDFKYEITNHGIGYICFECGDADTINDVVIEFA